MRFSQAVLCGLGLSIMGATSLAVAQAPDVTQLLSGKGAPLTLKLKDLDSNWRVFSVESGSYAGMISSMIGGKSSNEVFTKGETITAGSDVFLIVYRTAAPDMSAMMMAGGSPKTTPLTADSELKLGLLNLHAVTELQGIKAFNLDEEIASSAKAIDPFAEAVKAAKDSAKPTPAARDEPKLLANKTKAPDFTVHDANGKAVKLSQYKGHVVVLDFWATWCGPCQESLPYTSAVAKKYAPKGVVVLAVNVWDTKSEFNKWLPKHKEYSALKFAIDTSGQGKDVATSLYHVSGIPTQYIIDKKGRIVKSIVGFEGNDTELVKAIKAALGT